MYGNGHRDSLMSQAQFPAHGPSYSYAPPQRRNPYMYDIPARETAPFAQDYGAMPPVIAPRPDSAKHLTCAPPIYSPAAAHHADAMIPVSPSRRAASSPVTDRSLSSAHSSNEYLSSPAVAAERKALTSSFVTQRVPPEVYGEFLSWAKYQHPQSVERAITAEGFVDIDSLRDSHRSTLMHAACEVGNLSLVQHLCESYSVMHGVEHYDDQGRLPMHVAAENGLVSVVRYFILQRHLDANATTSEGLNVLHIAAKQGSLPLLRFALEETRLNVNASTGSYETPLLLACAAGYIDIVKKLLSDNRCNYRCVDSTGRNVLQIAAFHGHRSLFEFLLTSECLDVDVISGGAEGCFCDAIEHRDYNLLTLLSASLPVSEAMMPMLTSAANSDPVIRAILFSDARSHTASQENYTPRSDLTVSPRVQEPVIPVVGMTYAVVDAYDSPYSTPRTYSHDTASPVDASRGSVHLAVNGTKVGKSLISPASWSGAVSGGHVQSSTSRSVMEPAKSSHSSSWHGGMSSPPSTLNTPREDVLRALSTEDGDEAVSVSSSGTGGSSLVASRLQMFGGGTKSKSSAPKASDAPARKLVRENSSSASVKSTSTTCSTSSGVGGLNISHMFEMVSKGDVAELERLIGVTPNIRHDVRGVVDDNGSYLIHHAVMFGHLNVVQFLVEGLGCDIHKTDQRGRTALHIAVVQEHVLIVRYFTKYCGARLDLVCKEGKTVVDCSEELKPSEKRDEIRRTLQRAAAKSLEKRMKIALPMY